jgi:2-polyprenyl-6-methoxyphenol hydroxylase-like FAD-dependent oxidoreductase
MAKAGCDAQALAEHLRDNEDVDAALKGYNAERQPVGDTVVKHARKLGAHLGVNLATEEDRRMHELLQNDSAMLDWIAVPNFLAAYKWMLTSASGRLLHKPAKQRRKKLK